MTEETLGTLDSDPFPHVVLDGHWDEALLAGVWQEFPGPVDRRWKPSENGNLFASKDAWGPSTQSFFQKLDHPAFKHLLGITFNAQSTLTLGSRFLHLVPPGGYMTPHVADRRALNLVVFLSNTWKHGCGGELEFRATEDSIEVLAIPPTFNRTVIFETGPDAWNSIAYTASYFWRASVIASYAT